MSRKTSREELDRITRENQFEQKYQRDLNTSWEAELENVEANQTNDQTDSYSETGNENNNNVNMNNTMSIWRQETEFEKDRRLLSKEKEKHELNI